MTTIFEYSPPSVHLWLGMMGIAFLFAVIAIWCVFKMPWPMYGKLIPLWEYRAAGRTGAYFVSGFLAVLAFGLGFFAVSKQRQAAEFPSAKYVKNLPVAEGYVADIETYVIPANEDGRNRWCIRSFIIESTKFEFPRGLNTTSFCARDMLPAAIVETDYLRIHHDDGRVYKIERRRN